MARKDKKRAAGAASQEKADLKADAAPTFLGRIAVFGDSGLALCGSFVLLLVAIALAWNVDDTVNLDADGSINRRDVVVNKTDEDLYKKLGPIPDIGSPTVFSIDEDRIEDIHEAYKKDGVVAVRGLVPTELLERLDAASRSLIETETVNESSRPKKKQQMRKQFHTMQQSAIFLDTPVGVDEDLTKKDDNSTNLENRPNAFLEAALLSQIPMFASKLMLPELQDGENVRMLRDIFLAKDREEFICGWHVDDFGFWPATASSPGINAWVALDDMPAEGGGGFALAVGSHVADWKQEAHEVTGATTTFPVDGFQSAADMFENRTGSGTCNVQTAAPHLYRRMEDTKRIYNLLKGDIIFHQRWLFHRTVPFERDYLVDDNKNPIYRRYSIRYAPGSAVIPPGYTMELSTLFDPNNSNRTADQVSENDGPWYPQVYPSANTQELHDLKHLVENKLPIAQERRTARQKEIQPFLKQGGRQSQK